MMRQKSTIHQSKQAAISAACKRSEKQRKDSDWEIVTAMQADQFARRVEKLKGVA